MRACLIRQFLSFALIVAIGTVWMKSRATALDLQMRLAALTTVRLNMARELETERDRLRSALEEVARPQKVDAVTPPSSPAQLSQTPAAAHSLALGEWRSAREWRNEGQSTAQSAVATLLWAATGGDVTAMTQLIAYDDAARAQAQVLFDTLPPSARLIFPTPEALVAGLTIQAISNSAVQLSWFHQRDADHATVGLMLGAPDQAALSEIHLMPQEKNNPPMLADPRSNQFAVLSLQHSDSGWRVAIPAAAIKRLARLTKAPQS